MSKQSLKGSEQGMHVISRLSPMLLSTAAPSAAAMSRHNPDARAARSPAPPGGTPMLYSKVSILGLLKCMQAYVVSLRVLAYGYGCALAKALIQVVESSQLVSRETQRQQSPYGTVHTHFVCCSTEIIAEFSFHVYYAVCYRCKPSLRRCYILNMECPSSPTNAGLYQQYLVLSLVGV